MAMPTSASAEILLSHLIPAPTFLRAFTTCPHLSQGPHLTHLDLSDDSALGVHKLSTKTPPRALVVPPPARSLLPSSTTPASPGSSAPSLSGASIASTLLSPPSLAWQASYPAGSINPSSSLPGGFGLYLSGPEPFAAALEGATEAIFSYRMMLQGVGETEEGWKWAKGGKLPGVYGGEGTRAYGCTGGRQEERCKCFNLRPMWRPNAVGELYAYLPLTSSNTERLCAVPPKSVANSDYGVSVGRGAYGLQRAVGAWVTFAFRVRLNDVGADNGEIEMWIDGESVIKADGLCLRSSEVGRIRGMHCQTFFGGHTAEWASPQDQRAWFADFTGTIIR